MLRKDIWEVVASTNFMHNQEHKSPESCAEEADHGNQPREMVLPKNQRGLIETRVNS